MMQRVLVLISIVFLYSPFSFSIIDMMNANYSKNWVDLNVPGNGYNLTINRTYNSRSLYQGSFGFGMSSEYETNLTVSSAGSIIINEHGGGMRIEFVQENFSAKQRDKGISSIMAAIKKNDPKIAVKELTRIRKEISSHPFDFDRYAKLYNVKPHKVLKNRKYYTQGRKNEYVLKKGTTYVRRLSDNTYQQFDSSGKLAQLYDRNNNFVKITYANNKISTVTDHNGRRLTFKYKGKSNLVSKIVGPYNLTTSYKYKDDNLVQFTDTKKKIYAFEYDDLHNMTKIISPDKKVQKLTYDKNKDWVTSFTDTDKCKETYNYVLDKKTKISHYWSYVQKVCAKKTVNKSVYEFWYKKSANNVGSYLHRVKSDINGKFSDVVFHESFGKPITETKNKITISYSYYKNGLLKTKKEPFVENFYNYDTRCLKVSNITAKYYIFKDFSRKVASKKILQKQIKTKFNYDKNKCNLSFASNSEGQSIKVNYDAKGRIAKLYDHAKKLVKIRYDEKINKPKFIHRPGLGSITITYKKDGEIKNIKSKEGPQVAIQVANIFNNYLDIISPATAGGVL